MPRSTVHGEGPGPGGASDSGASNPSKWTNHPLKARTARTAKRTPNNLLPLAEFSKYSTARPARSMTKMSRPWRQCKIRNEVYHELRSAITAVEELRCIRRQCHDSLRGYERANQGTQHSLPPSYRRRNTRNEGRNKGNSIRRQLGHCRLCILKHRIDLRLQTQSARQQREIKDDLRKKREPCQVILTTSNKQTKDTLTTMHAEKIRQQCQNIIDSTPIIADDTTTAPPNLKGIARINNGIRVDCQSPEDALRVRQFVDWNKAFKELPVHKPKHGVVVHGVPIAQVTGIEDTDIQEGLIEEWEQANDIEIHSIKPLRRKPRTDTDRTPRHCSIMVFTENAHTADKCILTGFYIDSEHHTTAKYAPQLQCFNCCEYGHRAANCKRKTKCGNCASEDHKTSDCRNTESRCCGCKGAHPAWAQHCPLRNVEGELLENKRMETSPFFTS